MVVVLLSWELNVPVVFDNTSGVFVGVNENALAFGDDSDSELMYVVENSKSKSEAFEEGRRTAGDTGTEKLGVTGDVCDSRCPPFLTGGLPGLVSAVPEEVNEARPDREEVVECDVAGVAKLIGGTGGTGGTLGIVEFDELADLWTDGRKAWPALGG